MTSTTYYSPSSLSRHTSKYSLSSSSSSSSSSSPTSKFYLSSSGSSSPSSSSSSHFRTRSSYDLNSYRPSNYTSPSSLASSSSSYLSPSFSKSYINSSSYLTNKYSTGSNYSTNVTLTRFNQRRTSLDYNDNDNNNNKQCKPPVAGLTNLGNTCYLNSGLQALYATKQLRDFLLNSCESGGPLFSALSRLFKEMSSCPRTGYINPSSFRSAFIQYESKFRGFDQHDAQEALRYLINGVHEEVNKAKGRVKRTMIEPKSAQEAWNQYRDRCDDSKLIELFVGQYASVIRCSECHHESTCWDPFWDLSLAVPRYRSRVDIEECLAAFTEQETLDGNEQPFCSNCKKHRRSTKRLSIVRSPKILIIHLKKFCNDGYKLSSSDITVNASMTIDYANYELYACVCHHGSSSKTGHYTAYCQLQPGRWWHCNDEKVREVTDTFSVHSLKDAYVLFYRQHSLDTISERSCGSTGSTYSSASSASGGSTGTFSSKYSSRL